MSNQQFITPADRTAIDTMSVNYQKKTAIFRYTPSTGGTVTMPDSLGDMVIVIAPSVDIATLTLVWPSNPYNGQNIRVLSTKNIAAITHSGASLNAPCASLPATGNINFIYDLGGTTYMSDGISQSMVVSLPYAVSTASGAGNAVGQMTDNGLSTGNAIFATIQDITAKFDLADPNIAAAKAVISNSNKTFTINCQKQTFILGIIASSVTLGNAPNGVALTVLVHGILA